MYVSLSAHKCVKICTHLWIMYVWHRLYEDGLFASVLLDPFKMVTMECGLFGTSISMQSRVVQGNTIEVLGDIFL